MNLLGWACLILIGTCIGLGVLLDRYLASDLAHNLGPDHPHNVEINSQRVFLALLFVCTTIPVVATVMIAAAVSGVVGL